MADRFHHHHPSKRARNDDEVSDKDRISQLPSCILVYILSFLTLDEAARTSVLSKYWRGLWKLTPRLDLDGSVLLRNQATRNLSKGRQRLKYINWVNKVLKSVKPNKGMRLDEFRLSFELLGSTDKTLYNWLKYALDRRVKKLELDFSICDRSSSASSMDFYRFPRLLDPSTREFAVDPNCPKILIYTLVITDFTFLRSLSLSRVAVSGGVLEFIMRKFPFLEYLGVCESFDLVGGINVCGSALSLKHLEITSCCRLRSITVRDTRIVSLKVSWEPDLVLENNPKLVDVCVSKTYESALRPRLLSSLSGVEALTLFFSSYQHRKDGAKLIVEAPRLTKVKQLTLVVEEVRNDSFIHLLSLMRSSFPNLEKFVLKLNNISSSFMNHEDYGKPSTPPPEHLRVFELHGYCGRAREDGVVMHFVKNAASLRRITIKLSELNGLRFPHSLFGRCCNFHICLHDPFIRCEGEPAAVKKIRDDARVRAHHLKGGIPASIRVDII